MADSWYDFKNEKLFLKGLRGDKAAMAEHARRVREEVKARLKALTR